MCSSLAFERMLLCYPIGPHDGQSKEKRRPLARRRLHPKLPLMGGHDLLTNCQSHPGSGIFLPGMETLEHLKDARGVLGVEADAIISHRNPPILAFFDRRDMNLRRLLLAKL